MVPRGRAREVENQILLLLLLLLLRLLFDDRLAKTKPRLNAEASAFNLTAAMPDKRMRPIVKQEPGADGAQELLAARKPTPPPPSPARPPPRPRV